ncbi:MAG TPA: transcription-repair coupling factor [Candidatus Scatosoma pullistercoris]|uniref:Transcription-repair-coupling factor n=1 Tax=Candidatus Scatosoma pullistercoris TaxID=2840934 RepID=A0A9D1SGV6_9FIRM|nr:transcription-repair coupling factor [Candidatus Scatosoma pullistercoris]
MKEHFFSFDNIGGEYPRLKEELRRGTPTAVFGVSDSMKYLAASLIDAPVVYITADGVSARKAAENAAALSGKKTAVLAAKDEVLLYRKALSRDSLFRRLNGIYALQSGCPFVAAEIDALVQLFPARLPSVLLRKGEEEDFLALPARLAEMGYTRGFEVESKGTFAVRGDILDIFPINEENPVRVDFFGDMVEKIKPYDLVTGERLEAKDELVILAATDVFAAPGDQERAEKVLRADLKTFRTTEAYTRAGEIADELLSDPAGVRSSFLMPILGNSVDFFSVLPENAVLVFDEGKTLWDKFNALYKEHEERFHRLKDGGEAFSFSFGQYTDKEKFLEKISSFRRLALQTFTGRPFFFEPLKIFNFSYTPVSRYLNGFPALLTDVKNWLRGGYRVLLYCGDAARAAKMEELFSDEYISTVRLPDSPEEFRGVCVLAESLEKGFVLHECKLAVIGTGDLYTKAPDNRRIRRKRGDMFSAPEVGDYAVHETHGIGKVIGTRRIETTDGTKEYVALEYKDGDVLYVPAEHMDILSKYVGDANPPLSKIGGADFERVKARVRASLKKLAFDLKKLYAERAESKGFCFPENAAFMREFEDEFPYELTPDQEASIREIKGDMCSLKVMDRLLCGDVGFGKTEVAFRAVYLCVLAGKQAALMCPSTILCNQHFNTACQRFADFGVRVAALNRFNSPAEQNKILKGLAEGSIDFVVGTHRLLSADVKFRDLGLLVLDEEQRFGVEHKEKIKNLRKDVDCLTMTATPIPRTLHMSLTGIRDISTIQTPPGERLPVQTYVVEETETLIRDACIRELSRGGQVFILYNKVESIFTFAAKIRRILPEAAVSVAHGRMDKTVLENSVFDFYSGKSDILVTTTIIENGIDLPNANTLIVIDADRLGISQLYQLRGRVGRGTRLAHAYFTFKPERVMTQNASERLKAIMEFTELGAGYKLAMRDLEIRGAGNVLGVEQHGHMDKVGYELYAKLLKEELTGETQTVAELDIRADAYISEKYIESPAGRMDAYKQIAEISSVADYKRVYSSLEETYGPLPQAVINLLVVAVLKYYASKFNVRKITVAKGTGALEFPSLESLGDKRVQAAMDKYREKVRLNMSEAPVVEIVGKRDPAELMAEMTKFLKFALTFTTL